MDITSGLMGAAWLAIGVVFVWSLAGALRRALWERSPLPFYGMLERRGLTAAQLEQAVGVGEVARAVRRCVHCARRSDCGRGPVDCPNEPLFQRAKRLAEA
jgi:hypothetical protein